jgi:L-asparaginase
LILHGGAGSAIRDESRREAVRASLHEIVSELYPSLSGGAPAREIVRRGCEMLEDDDLFNAGLGSVLQSDGQIRMSAGLMDGARLAFSGVINVSRVQNPIAMAERLQEERDRIVAAEGATELAREMALPLFEPITERRLREWKVEKRKDTASKAAMVVAEGLEDEPTARDQSRSGTIGVVALDARGHLVAGTSTGGRGFERIGRVSDTAMPAGNYATEQVAVSCTGIGEDIIDECLAARIAVRVTDGMDALEAFDRSMGEGERRDRIFGAIGISARGEIVWGKTSDILLAAYHDGRRVRDTLDVAHGLLVERATLDDQA